MQGGCYLPIMRLKSLHGVKLNYGKSIRRKTRSWELEDHCSNVSWAVGSYPRLLRDLWSMSLKNLHRQGGGWAGDSVDHLWPLLCPQCQQLPFGVFLHRGVLSARMYPRGTQIFSILWYWVTWNGDHFHASLSIQWSCRPCISHCSGLVYVQQ